MHVFIDESGSFAGFEQNSGKSLAAVGALCIPDSQMPRLQKKYEKLRKRLPKDKGEVKGRVLSETDVANVVDVLMRNGAILEVSITDVGLHSDAGVRKYRDEVALHMESIKHRFNEAARIEVAETVQQIRTTPAQLFLQAVLTMDALEKTVQNIPLYFAQRQPKDISSFKWIVDSKDRSKTTDWEKWWSTYCQGVLANRSKRRPGVELKGADYSYFNRSYGDGEFTDLKLLFSDFRFSPDVEMGLELVDIVTNAIRRALVGNLARNGWAGLPGIMIHKRQHYISFINLEGASVVSNTSSYDDVVEHFTAGGKIMWSPRFLRTAGDED